MNIDSSRIWRVLFVTGGLLYLVGSFFHPRGMPMSEMLVQSAWIPSHATVFIGLLLITMGLVSYRRSTSVSARMNRWLSFAIVMAVVETFEMALHTMAYVDAGSLPSGALHAGFSTPVLSLHLLLATLVYTPFAVALIGLIWMGQREHSLGSPWIGWLGMVGAAAHGTVIWLAITLEINGAGLLFPIAALATSLWFVLAGLWPTRQDARGRVSDQTVSAAGAM